MYYSYVRKSMKSILLGAFFIEAFVLAVSFTTACFFIGFILKPFAWLQFLLNLLPLLAFLIATLIDKLPMPQGRLSRMFGFFLTSVFGLFGFGIPAVFVLERSTWAYQIFIIMFLLFVSGSIVFGISTARDLRALKNAEAHGQK